MTNFSKANLLREEFNSYSGGMFDKVLGRLLNTNDVLLMLNIPKSLYFRGEIFCDDIEDLSNVQFNQYHLMEILYNDFLMYIKRNPNPQVIYSKLLQLKESDVPIYTYTKDMSKNQLSNIIDMAKQTNGEHYKVFQFRMKKKSALRGEVLLADLYEAFPEHQFTLESVMELLYCDFICQIKRGDGEKAVESIVKTLISD